MPIFCCTKKITRIITFSIENIGKQVKVIINNQCIFRRPKLGSNFPDGLGVRIPDSHSGGPGSIPGQGVVFSPTETIFFNQMAV